MTRKTEILKRLDELNSRRVDLEENIYELEIEIEIVYQKIDLLNSELDYIYEKEEEAQYSA